MFMLAILYMAGLMNETVTGKGSLIEVTSPNRRVIVAEGNTAELVWNFETPREISQLNKTFHLCLTTSSGKALLKTVPGQTLTLPMKRVFRNIKISLTEKGKKNYEFKIKLTDVKVVDGGDFKLNIGAGLSLFKKDMSIKLIVVRMPTIVVHRNHIVAGKGEKVTLRWTQKLKGNPELYFRMNKELYVTISKRENIGSNRKVVLFQKLTPELTRIPPYPVEGLPEALRRRMKSALSFVIKHHNGQLVFKKKSSIKIKQLTAGDTGVYTLELRLPSGSGITKDIHLEVLDCFENSCYRFHQSTNGNWQQNRQQCQREDGDLVRMETRNEWLFVRDILQTKSDVRSRQLAVSASEKGWHVGLVQDSLTWIWVGTETQVRNADGRWLRGMNGSIPTNKGTCAAMFLNRDGKFHNLPCSKAGPFLCEVPKRK